MALTALFDRRPFAFRPRVAALAAVTTVLTVVASAAAIPAASASTRVTHVAAVAGAAAAIPAAATGLARSTGVRPSIDSLAVIGTSTHLTVKRVYRTGQVQWIDHVADQSLTNLNGCQAVRLGPSVRDSTYSGSVDAVCSGGPGVIREAVSRLHRSRPWYRMTVSQVPLVGFALLADLPTGNGNAVPAALAELPHGEFTFAEGDDVSLSYVGRGVTQAELDAAVAAFARALALPEGRVSVSRLFG